MDYVVGSIAALISGNVTPNRPKLIRRALTPTKHQISPNVTPKSEFVDDRSIFLSPSLQKKKAIVKKSPKRIFANPDLDITENSENSSPKADKVKKHLKEELEADEMGKTKSPSNKLDKSLQPVTPSKLKTNDLQDNNENTPKKKKRKSESVTGTPKTEEMDVDRVETVVKEKSPKKKERRKSVVDVDVAEPIQDTEVSDAAKEPEQTANVNQEGKKKKKRKKKNKASIATETVENENADKENKSTETTDSKTEVKNPKKKKNRKKNKKLIEAPKEQETAKGSDDETQVLNEGNDVESNKEVSNVAEENDKEDSDEEISNIANPNAITEKDTDSEHESDDEIESENEEDDEALKNDDAGDSSDDEKETKTKKGAKKNKKEVKKKDKKDKEGTSLEKEVNTEDEVKRTLFVGNVPFSNKCKKEIKKIFAQYGEIETVRIRTVPVKDARVTPKLAIIKNEIHPDRSTVNVYVKFTDPSSVERALAENNTVLNEHHLRVSRSGSTGVEHDPRCAVFLGNLPFGIEDETLRARFEKCGDIASVRIVRDKKTNAGKGFGYVNFTSKDGVELALSLSEEDLTVKNRIIRVKRCTQTLSKGPKNTNKSAKPGPRKDFGNNQAQIRNFGNNQGHSRNFGNQRNFNQNRNQGQNRNFGNNQGQNRNFGNNQGQNRNFGNNQGQNSNFGKNQGQNRNFGNNQGQNRNFVNNQGPRNFGNDQNRFGNQNDASGASRRIMNKRPHQESGDGPPNKRQHTSQPPREKKQRKEFVGITAEKKKKQKFDKSLKKKKAISEIMTKK